MIEERSLYKPSILFFWFTKRRKIHRLISVLIKRLKIDSFCSFLMLSLIIIIWFNMLFWWVEWDKGFRRATSLGIGMRGDF